MKRMGVLVAGLAIAGVVSAADLGECVSIKDDAVRLFCYDRVAGRAPVAAATAPSAAPATAAPAVTDAPAPVVAVPAPVAPAEEPKRIESRIVGSFDGWRQGTRFKLDNGQTWESIGTAAFNTRKMDAPAVVLERDFLGQMKLKVEGITTRAAVRRVDG